MQLVLLSTLFSLFSTFLLVSGVPFNAQLQLPKRTEHGVHIPLKRERKRSSELQRRTGLTGAVGVGDLFDVSYSLMFTIGGMEAPLILDTGSSDLWVASDACTDCGTVPLFPQATLASMDMSVELQYGDSFTGTHASGIIGSDNIVVGGLTVPNQLLAAINDTNTNVIDTACSGIFGLGFAMNSVIWNEYFAKTFASAQRRDAIVPRRLRSSNYGTRFFPDLSSLVTKSRRRSSQADLTKAVFASYADTGPVLTRMVASNALEVPMFTIALQRDSIDIGGNAGVLSLGELPPGVDPKSLTWNAIRAYPGVLAAPPDSPNEQYPIAWELFVDDVFFDGQVLPRSGLSPPSIQLSALVDTGNSLIRGPQDVLAVINERLGGSSTFACNVPHTLAFKIGGQMYPVDARDFIAPASDGDIENCIANVFETDAPQEGSGYQYSWSLGDPFLKGVLASFWYGNLTHPSQDPPRIGLLSTVPSNDGQLLQSALASAVAHNGGIAFSTFDAAPTAAPASSGTGVPQAHGGSAGIVGKLSGNNTGSAGRIRTHWGLSWAATLFAFVFCVFL